jgi:malonyl-CoA O-methyltransferase
VTLLAPIEAYRRWAPTYSQENVVTALDCELVAQLSPRAVSLRLLDVGCGTGRRLVDTGAAIAVGVEPCEEMLRAGREVHEFGPEVRFINGDARALALPDASFDLVWSRLVIGHLPECAAAYREFARVLVPQGQLIVTDFHPAACAAGLRRTFRDGDDVIEVEHHVHTLDAHVAAAAAAGLRLTAAADGLVGPSVRGYFEKAGKLPLYAQQCGMAVVLALSFVRDG